MLVPVCQVVPTFTVNWSRVSAETSPNVNFHWLVVPTWANAVAPTVVEPCLSVTRPCVMASVAPVVGVNVTRTSKPEYGRYAVEDGESTTAQALPVHAVGAVGRIASIVYVAAVTPSSLNATEPSWSAPTPVNVYSTRWPWPPTIGAEVAVNVLTPAWASVAVGVAGASWPSAGIRSTSTTKLELGSAITAWSLGVTTA